jgi:hypothetical protein
LNLGFFGRVHLLQFLSNLIDRRQSFGNLDAVIDNRLYAVPSVQHASFDRLDPLPVILLCPSSPQNSLTFPTLRPTLIASYPNEKPVSWLISVRYCATHWVLAPVPHRRHQD